MNNNNITAYFHDENKPKAQKHRLNNSPDVNADFLLVVYYVEKIEKINYKGEKEKTNKQNFYLSYQDCEEENDIFKNVKRIFGKIAQPIKSALLIYNLNCGNRVNTYYISRGEESPKVENKIICTFNEKREIKRMLLNSAEIDRLPRFEKTKVNEKSLQMYFNQLLKSQNLMQVNESQANAVINYMRLNYAKQTEAVEITDEKSNLMNFTSKSEITKYFSELAAKATEEEKKELRQKWHEEVAKLNFINSLNETEPKPIVTEQKTMDIEPIKTEKTYYEKMAEARIEKKEDKPTDEELTKKIIELKTKRVPYREIRRTLNITQIKFDELLNVYNSN